MVVVLCLRQHWKLMKRLLKEERSFLGYFVVGASALPVAAAVVVVKCENEKRMWANLALRVWKFELMKLFLYQMMLALLLLEGLWLLLLDGMTCEVHSWQQGTSAAAILVVDVLKMWLK